MADLFKEIIPSLLTTKNHCLEEEKDYVSFVINKAISQHDDGIFYAAEMNRMPSELPRRAQYEFYYHSLRAKRRPFIKWAKPIKEDDLAIVKQYYGYNDTKARDALRILNTSQLDMIRKILTIGA